LEWWSLLEPKSIKGWLVKVTNPKESRESFGFWAMDEPTTVDGSDIRRVFPPGMKRTMQKNEEIYHSQLVFPPD